MTAQSIAMLCVGCVGAILGVLLLAYRQKVADFIQREGQVRYGRFVPFVYETSRPGAMIPVGLGAILVGVILVARALSA